MKTIQQQSVQGASVLRAIINPKLLPVKKVTLPEISDKDDNKKILMPQQPEGYLKAKKHDCL